MQANISIPTSSEVSKRDQLVNLIIKRLNEAERTLQRQFLESVSDLGVRYYFIGDLLPEETGRSIYDTFPDVGSMRLMRSFREQKYTLKSFEKFNSLMRDITLAIRGPRVVISQEVNKKYIYEGYVK
jgi:hypothetical protein